MLRLLLTVVVLVYSALGDISQVAGSGINDQCSRDGDVRLEGGSHQYEGRVQICEGGKWTYICILIPGIHWSNSHGEVACRSLNYSTDSVETYPDTVAANSMQQHTTYKCNGNESNLTECITDTYNFTCSSVGKVICQVPVDERECKEGEIQLVTGNNNVTTALGQGRVEVCSETGMWGTVCDDNWDELDAQVVCRKLGFNGTSHEAVHNITSFGPGNGVILLTELECSGDEDKLTSCPHKIPSDEADNACEHSEDAAVICSSETSESNTKCATCQIRLTIGLSVVLGVVILLMIIITLIIAQVMIRRRKLRRQSATTTLYSEYITMYTSNDRLQYNESMLRWKEELAAYMVDSSLVKMEESLGEGCFGTVHKGVYHSESGDTIVAIKTIKSVSNVEGFISECVLMKDFDHPNVLELVGMYFDEETGSPLILLPYMANGDLRTYLHSKRDFKQSSSILDFPDDIDMSILVSMCRDVTRGMEYLVTNMFVHRDLAARNCMVCEDLTVKVADFGLSRDIYSKDYYRMKSKTLLPVKWMAPESLTDNLFTQKSDVWSFGVVCWEVFSLGSSPYPGVDNHEVSDYIAGGRRLKKPKLCPQDVYDTMCACWKDNPDERPEFSNLVQVFESMVQKYSPTQEKSHPNYVNIDNNHHQCNGT